MLAAFIVLSLAACSVEKPADKGGESTTFPPGTEQPAADWTRSGYFQDENENFLSVTYMEDIDEPGWYVGCTLGKDMMEESWGGTLPQEGKTLHGELTPSGSKDVLVVTISEEGDDGIMLTVEGGETYHFSPWDIPDATIFVTINTEGYGGMIEYAEGEEAPVIDPEWSYQSAQVNLAEPATYTFAAAAGKGSVFVKWTKNGEDFSTEPVITVLLEESADFVAVFESSQN